MFGFVFRRFMDFDHMVPAAVALAEAGHGVRLGVMGDNLDIADDPRLRLFPTVPAIWRLREPFARWKCLFFLRHVRCLVMDWAKRSQHMTAYLTDTARGRGVATIALPHSVDIVTSAAYYRDRLDADTFAHFDYVVCPNNIRRKALNESGVSDSRLRVLGSLRFNRAWSDRLLTVFPPKPDRSAGRLKVAYFDVMEPQRYEPTIAALRRLASLSFVDLAIQPKLLTRPENPQRTLPALFPDQIDWTHPSQLCQWADVVIGVSTSVIVEALVRGRHLIWPKYLDPDPLALEEAGAWVARSEDDLLTLVESLHEDRTKSCPDSSAFLTDLVCGGQSEGRVVEGYRDFLVSAANRQSDLKGAA